MNIVEILKDCPKGTKLYSPIFGEVILERINEKLHPHNIIVAIPNEMEASFTADGRYGNYNGEYMLFPSKDNRDWSIFKAPQKEYNFKPFDKVLVRDYNDDVWECSIFSHIANEGSEYKYICVSASWKQCIPFAGNEHLLGATNKPE